MKQSMKHIIITGAVLAISCASTGSVSAAVKDNGFTEPRALIYNYFYGPSVKSLLRDNQHVLCDVCPPLPSLLAYVDEAKPAQDKHGDPQLIPFVPPMMQQDDAGAVQKSASANSGERKEVAGHTAYFGFDRFVLSKAEKNDVERYLDGFKATGGTSVRVEGHTCDVGPRVYNQKLSVLRAKAVARIATEKGLDVEGVVGFGETQPVSKVRAKNRIAIIFVKEGVLHEN